MRRLRTRIKAAADIRTALAGGRAAFARCFAALAVLFAAATLQGCADFLVRVSTHPPYHGNSIRHECRRWEKRVPGITAWIDSLRSTGAMKDTIVVADDGVKLHAYYMDAAAPSLRTAIVVHGFVVNQMNVMMLARMYRDSLGYNVLLPALRHHGKSGGKEVQFGWKDRLDLLRWAEVAHGIFADTLQVFHGESMGAATVMMASGEQTPPYVRGFIEDCGYTSVWDIMSHCQQNLLRFHGCRFPKDNEFYAPRKSGLQMLEDAAVAYADEGWRLLGLMKQMLDENHIDIEAKVKEWREAKRRKNLR